MTYVERAEIPITDPTAFAQVLPDALPLVRQAPGCLSVRALRGVEAPETYLLLIEWESVEAHTTFTGTEQFARFVGLVREHYAGPSSMGHFQEVMALA
jgi:heme-degrading monooxygenase HmoA